ncbi:G-protein beta WD-40 repeat [Phytophthora cactorum]|nr:G-protein beta WD-40 repeat [Phytophthora cactorum]
MVLTDKQRQDLHQAMLDYLVGMGERFADTAAAFEKEADVTKSSDGKHAGLLEKKWTSVIRLQRKVMELETKLAQLEENAKLGGVLSRRDVLGARQRTEFLPRAPAKFSLTGHRSPITVKVWDFETGEYERTLKGHTNPVQAVAFNGSGSLLASTSTDLSIKIWDFSSDGDYECLRTLRGHDHNVCGIVFGPISRATDCYCVNTLNAGHTDWVRDVAVSDDGLYLASCGNDRSILFWDLQHMRVLQSIREHEHVVESVVFAKTGQEQVIEKIHSKKLAATGALAPANGSVSPNSFSLDPAIALCVCGKAFSGMQLMMFASHENWVREVRFHPSGKYALSAGEDKTIRVFDVDTGRCVRTLDEAHSHFVTCLDVHPSLPLIISGGIDKIINVWECV